jgi:hypothetical protein
LTIHPPGKLVKKNVSVSVADPGSGAFLTSESGMGKNSGWVKIRIRDEQPASYFRELGNDFLGYNSLIL